MILDDLSLKQRERKEKNALYASDFGKAGIDVFFSLVGEPETNPTLWYSTLKMAAGKAAEEVVLQTLKDSDVVKEDYSQEKDGYIDFEFEGVPVHGYMDGIHKDGFPIEVKTINNANSFDVKKYQQGNPRENYVGQIGIYMFARNSETGWLLVISIDGLNRFLFRIVKNGDGIYQAGNTVVDVKKELKRLSMIYKLAKERKLPKELLFEKRYKYDIDSIDWSKLSKTKISNARNNRAVIGDWEIQYSPWKNKIIELQGTTLGYTEDELKRIRKLTENYTR